MNCKKTIFPILLAVVYSQQTKVWAQEPTTPQPSETLTEIAKSDKSQRIRCLMYGTRWTDIVLPAHLLREASTYIKTRRLSFSPLVRAKNTPLLPSWGSNTDVQGDSGRE